MIKQENDNIKYEISCGAYVVNDDNKVLLVQHRNGGHWDFPKGHMELNETKKETAVREVFEETGVEIEIVSDKEYEITYEPKVNTLKTVIFFEAKCLNDNLKKQECEVIKAEWLYFKDALERLTFENSKSLFERFITERKQ